MRAGYVSGDECFQVTEPSGNEQGGDEDHASHVDGNIGQLMAVQLPERFTTTRWTGDEPRYVARVSIDSEIASLTSGQLPKPSTRTRLAIGRQKR